MNLDHLVAENKEIINDRNISKGYRSQLQGVPTGKIMILIDYNALNKKKTHESKIYKEISK